MILIIMSVFYVISRRVFIRLRRNKADKNSLRVVILEFRVIPQIQIQASKEKERIKRRLFGYIKVDTIPSVVFFLLHTIYLI